jgi:hypothetical protein
LKAWHDRCAARPAVERGAKAGAYLRDPNYQIGKDPIASKILFGQRARSAWAQIGLELRHIMGCRRCVTRCNS